MPDGPLVPKNEPSTSESMLRRVGGDQRIGPQAVERDGQHFALARARQRRVQQRGDHKPWRDQRGAVVKQRAWPS